MTASSPTTDATAPTSDAVTPTTSGVESSEPITTEPSSSAAEPDSAATSDQERPADDRADVTNALAALETAAAEVPDGQPFDLERDDNDGAEAQPGELDEMEIDTDRDGTLRWEVESDLPDGAEVEVSVDAASGEVIQ